MAAIGLLIFGRHDVNGYEIAYSASHISPFDFP
jgi:hypothetical protein